MNIIISISENELKDILRAYLHERAPGFELTDLVYVFDRDVKYQALDKLVVEVVPE